MIKLFSLIAILSASAAMADNKQLSWDEFRESCLYPAQFHNQRPPQNIKVTCSDIVLNYVQASSGNFNMPSARNVTSSLISDKYSVVDATAPVAIPGKVGVCTRYKQVQQTFAFERVATCDDVIGFKGGITDFCTVVLDDAKAKNQRLVGSRETGVVIDSCSGRDVVKDPNQQN